MTALITLNERGTVTLPAKLRKSAGLHARDVLMAEVTPLGILLRPTVTLPLEMYSEERIREFDQGEDELAVAMKKAGLTQGQ
jgi:bifunctional DNA-binding transcriptional regulator/antitoxin component of YhaV-PrlF toxin-antitoxin module